MAVEMLLVFALKAPPSGLALQEALAREPFPVVIADAASFDLQRHTGSLPVSYKSVKTGFFVYPSTPAEFKSSYPEASDSQPSIRAVVSFQFGGNPLECVVVMRTALVLVANFSAKAFDPQSRKYVEAQDLNVAAEFCGGEAKALAIPAAPVKPRK